MIRLASPDILFSFSDFSASSIFSFERFLIISAAQAIVVSSVYFLTNLVASGPKVSYKATVVTFWNILAK